MEENAKNNCIILLKKYEEGYTKETDEFLKDNLKLINENSDFYNSFKEITQREFPKLYEKLFSN